MNRNNNYTHDRNTKFMKNFKSLFNFSNIIDGAKLIKHYYICLIPISFSILVTFIIYPHIRKFIKKTYMYILFICMHIQ